MAVRYAITLAKLSADELREAINNGADYGLSKWAQSQTAPTGVQIYLEYKLNGHINGRSNTPWTCRHAIEKAVRQK